MLKSKSILCYNINIVETIDQKENRGILLSHKTSIKISQEYSNIIGHMCYAASKLWNICNYERRHYKELGLEKYPDWYYQKKAHKGNLWYKQLSQNGHYLSIDPGLHNLMTCYDSGNGRTFILGRKYLSLERYFHKEIARVQSVWYAQQSERGIKYPKSSKHIQRLYRKKQNAVKDYLHKVTRWIAEYCRKEDIRCVVVGDMRNIRKEKDMGHKTNQKFHGLPYNKLYIMMEYKLKLYGIQLIKQEESYTSQCSPLSPEASKRYAEASNRKERGMYITDGVKFNADAVGAFNILRKYLSVSGKQKELSVTGLKNPEIIKVAA